MYFQRIWGRISNVLLYATLLRWGLFSFRAETQVKNKPIVGYPLPLFKYKYIPAGVCLLHSLSEDTPSWWHRFNMDKPIIIIIIIILKYAYEYPLFWQEYFLEANNSI
jgi:hypothetical protein